MGSRPGDPEAGPRRFGGRGRSRLTLKTSGCPGAGPRMFLRKKGRSVLTSLEPDTESRPGDPDVLGVGVELYRPRGAPGQGPEGP